MSDSELNVTDWYGTKCIQSIDISNVQAFTSVCEAVTVLDFSGKVFGFVIVMFGFVVSIQVITDEESVVIFQAASVDL